MFTSLQTATMMAYEEKIVASPMHCKHTLSLSMFNVHFCIFTTTVTNLEYSKEAINCKVAIDNRHKVWLNKTFSPKVLKSLTKKKKGINGGL